MSEKNRDNKNRWRNVTIAFRMSPEENEELDLRVKLCGYQTRQEYIIESVLHQKVTAVGNPLMLVQFRKQLRGIEEELKRLTILEDADEELFTPIRTMLEILNAFAEERNYERRIKEPFDFFHFNLIHVDQFQAWFCLFYFSIIIFHFHLLPNRASPWQTEFNNCCNNNFVIYSSC